MSDFKAALRLLDEIDEVTVQRDRAEVRLDHATLKLKETESRLQEALSKIEKLELDLEIANLRAKDNYLRWESEWDPQPGTDYFQEIRAVRGKLEEALNRRDKLGE